MTARFVIIAALAVLAGCGGGSRRQAQAEARARAEAEEAKAREEARAALEAGRLAALWTYHEMPVGNSRQVTARLRSADNVDTGGAAPAAVLLVFRDHPSWGRSSYLVLEAGDFDCGKCTVSVTVDEARPRNLAAHRPRTNEAIALFIDDEATLWALTTGAKRLRIEFPAKAGGTRAAEFEVGGLDSGKMPGW